jgi:hypothetical protein
VINSHHLTTNPSNSNRTRARPELQPKNISKENKGQKIYYERGESRDFSNPNFAPGQNLISNNSDYLDNFNNSLSTRKEYPQSPPQHPTVNINMPRGFDRTNNFNGKQSQASPSPLNGHPHSNTPIVDQQTSSDNGLRKQTKSNFPIKQSQNQDFGWESVLMYNKILENEMGYYKEVINKLCKKLKVENGKKKDSQMMVNKLLNRVEGLERTNRKNDGLKKVIFGLVERMEAMKGRVVELFERVGEEYCDVHKDLFFFEDANKKLLGSIAEMN